MSRAQPPVTGLCRHALDSIHYRDASLVDDLLGQRSFTEVMFMQIMGRAPRPVDLRVTTPDEVAPAAGAPRTREGVRKCAGSWFY